ncbi:1-(5-phosphoribosyl)-5-((5-phosphoribosylamino)methylideneamino)imidazole-4-carboxamide isomerase [Oleiphilus sp. HI0071]|jgi:DUF971 family protein|uniref:gamma-butyrobetaine hydroxylase-like domain-containing protein n=1 Tax=unclassified Oleiphilus TaxID=2631174 RepID=UPI0007C30745|nr:MULTISPECIES: DUF971 domain-containing protein [unclassified Oleiphilus]KZY73494.1 1-(5-phosphoribosyl)-5-((5-phosphoribosylamino)methylideneamino)imidazole-4-carboxamide isomerase [Oleiphilus sp. HI0065]KZY82706.1 1-(5-phosphoribosyl)-5-((5-phosphoribosylamino)methylideneamino)imidazole-4-carboxamide isomerase [Oleiphilus sp. HI0071]KZY90049.1 1-(5-phosphoribosyl)-5-((5-phosphoribosylamino)methylideneamino)imidazole-4-carboxamide isomerase [Oleiphilus sp. HI0073]KZZ41687.1 1-(5-phosphoribos
MIPSRVEAKQQSRVLLLQYPDGTSHELSFEYLRVLSPSAEVQGHGKPILQFGKKNVLLKGVEQAGNYALKLVFDDGHDSGLYTWDYLRKLCVEKELLWQRYLNDLNKAGRSR